MTVFLDVPLEALAKRVVAVGTHSRPLLGESSGDSPYEQVCFQMDICVCVCVRARAACVI